MAFSAFLDSRRKDCKELVDELKKTFSYVSILGSDIKSKRITADFRQTGISDGMDTECGFVIKMNNGKAFFEYSLDDICGDKKKLADKIVKSLGISINLNDKMISANTILDEPMEKSFKRESDFENYKDSDILDFAKDLVTKIKKKSKCLLNTTVILGLFDCSKLFVSENKMLDQNYTWVNGILYAVYEDNDTMVYPREGANSNCIKKVLDILPTKVDKLIDKAAHLVKSKPIEPGYYDIITDPSITGLIAHEAFGHGVEMDQFVKDRALAKSYVNDYVASNIVNMRDGAASTLSVASYFFDDDGVLAHDTQIIKNGVLVAGLSDLVSASELGTEPTGNGRRESYQRKAYSRMTNTFIEKGTDKLEDMIKSIKHGYMLFETNNGMEDPKNWAIQCVAEYGIEIIDGKLTENYVSPVILSGYVPDLLKSISMISDEFEIEGSGFCGKGYKEWVRVSDGGPHLKAKVKLS